MLLNALDGDTVWTQSHVPSLTPRPGLGRRRFVDTVSNRPRWPAGYHGRSEWRPASWARPPAESRRLARPPAVPASGQRLGLAVDEVIHHDEVPASPVTPSQVDITAADPNEEDFFAGVEGDPEEREGLVAPEGRHEAAEQERAVDVEVLDLRRVVPVDVGEDAPQPLLVAAW